MSDRQYCIICGHDTGLCICPAVQFYPGIVPKLLGWTPVRGEVENLRAELAQRTAERDDAQKLLALFYFQRGDLRDQLAAKDARIAELDTMLAQRPALDPVTPATALDPFRDFPTDRRRIGG